jgi:rSAM/selenodomain-associated transferase 1
MIVVMAKVPLPGVAKTRLVPRLGERGAAHLCAAMTGDVLETVRRTGLRFKVAVAGPYDHPWVRSLRVPTEPQADGDLGVRLAHALREGGVAIGTDAPTLPAAFLRRAERATADVVLAPSFDGGYVLVGCRDATALFDEVPWSSRDTYRAQVARAQSLQRSVLALPFWYDVDEPGDLDFLASHLATLPAAAAPRTRAFLESLHAPPPG